MASTFSWLDNSSHDKDRMQDLIALFREKDTVDELGIGAVRDAFADRLFPGTSTIQRRVRYFFFIAWQCIRLEERKVSSKEAYTKLREQEIGLIDALLESGEEDGIIGVRSKKNLKRLPSDIYWQGLGRLGLRLFEGSREAYFRRLDTFQMQGASKRTDEAGDLALDQIGPNWHPAIPSQPDDFPKVATFNLTSEEADYLKEQIITRAPDSLFATLMNLPHDNEAEFPWQHKRSQSFNLKVKRDLTHARNFSDTIHGAALVYNLMLAEARKDETLVQDFQQRFSEWTSDIALRLDDLKAWSRDEFWTLALSVNPGIPHPSRLFIQNWLTMTIDDEPFKNGIAHKAARELIRNRELNLKRDLARLQNPRALELWTGASGIGRLDFRWRIARGHIADIHRGLA